MKVVVFDVDCTLGYFSELSMIWDCLTCYMSNEHKYDLNKKEDFINLLDLFPEFIRPNMINILKYLKYKKHTKQCSHVIIYSNNRSKEWLNKIKCYLEYKINYRLFDKIIAGFKDNSKQIELCRSTNDKCIGDLINCTKFSSNTDICFIDDICHKNMINDKVYYIYVKPYEFDLPYLEIINRITKSHYFKRYIKNKNEFQQKMLALYKQYKHKEVKKTKQDYEIDKIIGKKILAHLNIFFK